MSSAASIVLMLLCLLLPVRGRGEEARGAVHFLCWTEYVPQAVLDGFTKATGVPVELETYQSNEEMLAKLRARPSGYDLVQPSGYYVKMLAEAGELAPLDGELLPNGANLDPEYRKLPFDPEGKYSIPWLAGTVGIVVNTHLVNRPIADWEDVFRGESGGKIVVVDDAREMVAWALASAGRPITEVSDEALQAVAPTLRRWLPQVAVFDSDNPKEALLDGRAEIGILWSGEAALLWAKDHAYRFILPKSGAHRFIDNLAIPKGARNVREAHALMNYCLEPRVSVLISRAYPYTNPNAAARRLLTEEERANPASYPSGMSGLPMLSNLGNSTAAVTEFVRKLRAERPAPATPPKAK